MSLFYEGKTQLAIPIFPEWVYRYCALVNGVSHTDIHDVQ